MGSIWYVGMCLVAYFLVMPAMPHEMQQWQRGLVPHVQHRRADESGATTTALQVLNLVESSDVVVFGTQKAVFLTRILNEDYEMYLLMYLIYSQYIYSRCKR